MNGGWPCGQQRARKYRKLGISLIQNTTEFARVRVEEKVTTLSSAGCPPLRRKSRAALRGKYQGSLAERSPTSPP